MPFNVPKEDQPKFSKNVRGAINLLSSEVTGILGQTELETSDTLYEAYNQPIAVGEEAQAPDIVGAYEQVRQQEPADMVSIDPQAEARRIEVDSLRMPDGNIYRNANELFSEPLTATRAKAIGLVDAEGNATPRGELFFNLKESGLFNEDGTMTKKGQAYSMSERDLENEANLDAFTTLWDDEAIRPSATFDEQLENAASLLGNVFGGFTDLMQTFGKSINPKNAFDVITRTPKGKKLEAEFQTNQLAAIEKIITNFANLGSIADVGQAAIADTVQAGDVAMVGPGGVPMYTQSVEALKQQNADAERDLYAARQRQWKQNRDIQSFEVGQIAETVLGLDGAVNMAQEAKNTLGADEFNKRYAGVGAFSELAFDPINLIPASVAFKVAGSVPLASRLELGAQKILGKVAQTESALADVQAVVQAGNAVLKKEALFVPRYQQLFKNMSARSAGNPELMVKANEALDAATKITASADEVRAAMPTAMGTLEELTAKRNSLATRIPEAYAQKVMQTTELGRRIQSAPARTMSSILERTGETLTKVDDAVTGYLKDRGLDQAYNAALGASGVVGLAGNPLVGAVGITGAALKTGKFLSEYGKILRYVGKEMENARGQIPFWKRVAAHTAPGSLGRGIAHTFNIFELGGATSDIIRRTGRGIAAAYPVDLMFEWLSDGADMRPETMTRAAAESLVIGGSFAAGGGAFMGTKKRMRELAIGDEINFRRNLTDTKQKALYEALPPGVRRSMATYSIANPTLNYNFSDTANSQYLPSTNTAIININSTNPLKALVAHETLHHTLIKNNMEGGIAALFLGDIKTNAAGGLFRSKDGKLDPEFESFSNAYYKRLRDGGMTDAEIRTEYGLDKVAVEYFIEQHADQYSQMAETGELGALAARGEVRKKLGSVLETILPKIPVLRDLHIKSGGMIDKDGAWVKGNGILGDDKIRQNPIANRIFREMNRRSSGMMPGQFEPLFSDKEGSGAPLLFDPTNEIDQELMHPFIKMDDNNKPILKDGKPVFIDKSVDIDRAMAGLTALELMRKRRESNYVPEKGEAYVDDDGELQPGWLSDAVLTEMLAKHKFNNEQKRMIRQTNKLIKQGDGQRMVMINFPATTRLKSGKVVYAPQKAAIRDAVPVAMTISKDGNILYGLMSVTKLQENIKKRSQDRRGKKLYGGNVDLILRDTQAMMDFHKKGEDSINYFNEKYGVVEGDQRKKFINTMFGLLNKKEQAVLNPMLLEDGIKSKDNVYRTYRADRVSKAVPMAPEEYAAMPFSYEAVSQVRMPEAQRAMPEGEQTPTRFMPEGVDEDRFYSQLDRVITDKVPTRATAQQIMATIDPTRGSGVKADEIKWSGIEQALASLEKDGKVSKEDLLNYLRNEGMVRFEEVTLGAAPSVYQENGRWYVKGQENLGYSDSKEQAEELASRPDVIETAAAPKFSQYVLPGGENYREVVLAMPLTDKGQITKLPEGYSLRPRLGGKWGVFSPDNRLLVEGSSEQDATDKGVAYLEKDRLRFPGTGAKSEYTSSHFPDIPNYVAHMRTNERTLDDGSEGLFVEEFQSDRHQEGRKKGYRGDKVAQKLEDLDIEQLRDILRTADPNGMWSDSERENEGFNPLTKIEALDQIKEFQKDDPSFDVESFLRAKSNVDGVADAPFRTTWPIQLFKRALRDAVDGGKDWVGWTTGETQAERFDLSKQVDAVEIFKRDTGNWGVIATKNGNRVLSREATTTQLPDLIGKELAEKAVSDGGGTYKGDDLKVGGSGMRGFYDNMLPKEVGKYVKQFGGKVEKADMTQSVEADIMSGEEAETGSVPIWKVNITPEMRKISQTGQMRFMPEKLDSDYMKAVESGDVEAQQRMVDEAAKQAGYRQGVLWHGSRGKKFTVFDETKGDRLPWMEGHVGHYFSPDKNIASAMGSNVLGAYLKMDNPLILDAGDYSYSAITPARKKEIQKQGYDSVIGTPQTNAGKQEFIVFDSNQIKSADPITRDDSGNVIPLSKRFDVGSKDIRYMPEGDVPTKKPLSRTDTIPDIDSTVINFEANEGEFDYSKPAKVYIQHPNGERMYFNYDPAYLVRPEFKDLRKTLAGKNVIILEADRMRATGGDMGGPMHPFLRSNQVSVVGPDGKKYKAIWANMTSAFVTGTKNRWFNDNAEYALIHIMDSTAHASNKRIARTMQDAWNRANLSEKDQRIISVAMQAAITAQQKSSISTKITQLKNKLKDGEYTKLELAEVEKDIQLMISNRDALSWTGIDAEIAKLISKIKTAQTRFDNNNGKQAAIDKAKKQLDDYLNDKPEHSRAFNNLSEKASSFAIIDNIGKTFQSRGAAIKGLVGITAGSFNPTDILRKTEDFVGGENMDIVGAVQLSKNKDIFAVYFGSDPKEEAAMSPQEKEVRDKLRADPNFVEHEAFDWMMLGPDNADNFLSESTLKPEELFPNYRSQHPKASVKEGSDETVLGAMKKYAAIPLKVVDYTKAQLSQISKNRQLRLKQQKAKEAKNKEIQGLNAKVKARQKRIETLTTSMKNAVDEKTANEIKNTIKGVQGEKNTLAQQIASLQTIR